MTGAGLRDLARRVRRLPSFGRLGPEAVAEERDEIAVELERLARTPPPRAPQPRAPTAPGEAGGIVAWRAPQPQPPRAGTRTADERVRRLEALARAQAEELERLRDMLAKVVRRPPRRGAAGAGQMELPL